ncbi:MAG: ATP-binding cassette domain-containing protein, partial [Clostridia bacterium]|nr:ATP-binding cassette domain-containing protein [Clostridia bacterium]
QTSDIRQPSYLTFAYELKSCKLPREEHIAEVCEVVKIGDVRKRVIRNLSKGYKQRVGIAQALIGNPKVIIFDEPTIGLDPKQIIEIRNLIRTLGKGHTVILSTHILQEVQAVCDRIVIINKGKIVADELTENISRAVENNHRFNVKICGPSREVLAAIKSLSGIAYAEVLAERDGEAYTYMIESEYGVDVRKKLFYTMAERGWAIIGLEALGMSLEDIFITVVDKSADDRLNRPNRTVRRRAGSKDALEKQVAETMLQEGAEKRAAADATEIEDEE